MKQQITRQSELITKINASPHAKDIWKIMKHLQSLVAIGYLPYQVDEVIKQMDLDFKIHLFITANYTDLMGLEVPNV